MVIVIRRSYEVVTDETARHGDVAASGWLTADGRQWSGDWKEGRKQSEIRFDSAKKAADFIAQEGAIVGDDGYSNFYMEPHQNLTGEYVSTAVHVEGTRREIERIWDHLATVGSVSTRMGMPFKPVQRSARRVKVGSYRRAR